MENLRPNADRAQQTIIFLWIIVGMNILSVLSSYMQYNMLTSGDFSAEAADMNDLRESVLGILHLIIIIITAVVFIRWFRRAYYNLHLVVPNKMEHSEGWAAGAWFVPFLNLVRPYTIMKEIWLETQRNGANKARVEPADLVGWWWAFFILRGVMDNIASRVTLSAEDISGFETASILHIVSAAISIPAALLAIQVVKKVSEFEKTLTREDGEVDILEHLVEV